MYAYLAHNASKSRIDSNKWLGHASLQAICALLKLDAEAFRKGLCTRLIVAGTEKMVKQESAEKAKQGRDALAKALYSRLFDHVVQCVNRALRAKGANKGPTMQVHEWARTCPRSPPVLVLDAD
jgi:myosin heavy subunit